MSQCQELRIFVSAPREQGGVWSADWDGLPIREQRTLAWRETSRQRSFNELLTIHVPYDTVPLLREFRPDVVISGEMGMRTLQAAAFRKSCKGSRMVLWATVSEVTEQSRGHLRRWLRRRLLRSADAVIVNGHSGARYVQGLGTEASKVFCVPQTTDIEPFLARSGNRAGSARKRLLYCGRLIEQKGIIPFIAHLSEYAAQQPAQRIEFCIAGDGPLRSQLATLSCPRNLDLQFLGHVSYDRLPDVYVDAGILAFPSFADEWGLVVVEGMASGLPILGSLHSQAVEDLVEDGRTGWVFRPDDPRTMRAAIHRALNSTTEQLDELGARARQRVQCLTPSAMADQMMSAIEYAVANGS